MFGCLPSEAETELLHGDSELVKMVMLMRQFAATKHAIDNAAPSKGRPVPKGPMVELVAEVTLLSISGEGAE